MWLVLGIAAMVAVACALKARAAAPPPTLPPGTGSVPDGSGTPTGAATASPDVATVALILNTVLHTAGSAAAGTLLSEFQKAAGVPETGVYDAATAKALATYVSAPPAPDS